MKLFPPRIIPAAVASALCSALVACLPSLAQAQGCIATETISTSGIWVAPASGGPFPIRVIAYGAAGGSKTAGGTAAGGYGAYAFGTFTIQNGETLHVITGQKGLTAAGGSAGSGGGASAVIRCGNPANCTAGTILVVGGGGGGRGTNAGTGINGQPSSGSGGGGAGHPSSAAGGGGGLNAAGLPTSGGVTGGAQASKTAVSAGGAGTGANGGSGFGGGGGTASSGVGGGGGGYTGGDAGQTSGASGFGGHSFSSAADAQTGEFGNSDEGYVILQSSSPYLDLRSVPDEGSISDGSNTPATYNNTDFGMVSAGAAVTKSYTISNYDYPNLTVTGISFTGSAAGDYVVSGLTFPVTVASNESVQFSITFTPSATGARPATVHIANNDCNRLDFDFAITGEGLPPCVDPPEGLIGWWPGNGNANNIYVAPGVYGGHNGSASGDVTYTAAKVGQGFTLSGNVFQTSYVTILDDDGDFNAGHYLGWATSFWMKGAPGQNATVVEKTSGGNGWVLDVDAADNKLRFRLGGSTGTVTIATNAAVLDNQFHHIAAVLEVGGTMRLYVDGVAQTQTAVQTNGFGNDDPISIGWLRHLQSQRFAGVVDELQVYSQPLTAAHVQAIYDAGAAGMCAKSYIYLETGYLAEGGSEGGGNYISAYRYGVLTTAVSVNYATVAGGTATAGASCTGSADYVTANSTINFAAGEIYKTGPITICDDGIHEPDETINVQLSNPAGPGAALGTPSSALVSLYDNEPAFAVTSSSPANRASNVARAANVTLNFSYDINASTVSGADLAVSGGMTALYGGTLSLPTASSLMFDPSTLLKPGELINVTLFPTIQDVNGFTVQPYTMQFRVATTAGSGNFGAHLTTPSFGIGDSSDLALGDLDNDGDIDVVVANANNQAETVWLNNGTAGFSPHPTTPSFGGGDSRKVVLGDLDRDGDLDAIVANYNQAQTVWVNNGSGQFSAHPTTPSFGSMAAQGIALGDVDADGDLDVVIATPFDERCWLNDGNGNFSDTGYSFSWRNSSDVALGDIDGNGTLDLVVANLGAEPEAALLGLGFGYFYYAPTAEFGAGDTYDVELGDLDGDGDLDAVFANASSQAETVWLNDGAGNFSAHPTVPSFGTGNSRGITLGDLDADGDLDVLVANSGSAATVWLNNGSGAFNAQPSVASFGSGTAFDTALGDLDADGDLDAVVARSSAEAETVWLNNGPPSVTTSAGAVSYTENDTVVIDSGLALADGDANPMVASATVTVITGYVNGQDSLGFVSQNGITGTFDPNTGTLSLSGVTTLANYQAALRSVTYTNLSDNPSTSQRTVRFVVNDGTENSNAATRNITVSALNDPPTISNVADTSTAEDTASGTINFTVGDAETAAGTLTVTATSGNTTLVPNANLVLGGNTASRTLNITPAPNQNGSATITLTVSDGASSANDTFVLTVTAVNDPPTISDISDITIDEDEVTTINFTVNDVDNDPASLQLMADPSCGFYGDLITEEGMQFGGSGNNRTVQITPAANEAGECDVTIHVSDGSLVEGEGFPGQGYASDSFHVTVEALNDPPVANDDVATAKKGRPVIIPVAANDTDPDFDSLFVSDVTQGANGTVTAATEYPYNTVTYTPANGFVGTDTFTYEISDGYDATDTAQVTVNVVDVMVVTAVSPAQNELDISRSANLQATFDRPFDTATVTAGSFVVSGEGTGRYAGNFAFPNASSALFDPTGTFRPGELITATLTSAIESPTDVALLPFVWQFRAAVEGGTGRFAAHPTTPIFGSADTSTDIALGDLDGDGDLDVVVTNSQFGGSPETIWLNNGSGNYSLHASFDSGFFTGAVAIGDLDGDGDLDLIFGNNGAKVWLNGGSANFSFAGSFHSTFVYGIALGDLDGDGDLDAVLVSYNQAAPTIWLNNGTGSFSAHPTTPYLQVSGLYSTLDAAFGDIDGDGDLDLLLAVGTENVWVNDGAGNFSAHPVTPSLSTGQAQDVVLGDLDGDGDLDAIFADVNDPNSVWKNNGTGSFTAAGSFASSYTTTLALGDLDADGDLDAVAANFSNAAPEAVWLNNGTGTFSAHPTTPSFGGGASTGIAMGDLDGDGDLDVVVANQSAEESVWLNNSAPVVTPSSGAAAYLENGTVAVDANVAVTDDGGTIASATVAITGGFIAAEDSLGFVDQNGISGSYNTGTGVLTLTGTTTVANYQAALRSITYTNTSDNPSTAQRTVTFQVNDGTTNSNAAARNITITEVNDAPTAVNDSLSSVAEDSGQRTISFTTLTSNDSAGPSESGQALIVKTVSTPVGGTVSISGTNVLFTPTANFNGSASFNYTVEDNGTTNGVAAPLTSGPATASFAVDAVNDAPFVVSAISDVTVNEDAADSVLDLSSTFDDVDIATNGDVVTLSVTGNTTPGLVTASFSGTDLTLDYQAQQNGSTTITVRATDVSGAFTEDSFVVTVNAINDAPTISDVGNQSTNEDVATGAIAFTVGDVETAAGSLIPNGTSNNTALVPNANIVFGGSGANRTVTITPAANQNGTATITVSVSDGTDTASDTFVLTVTAVNDEPTLNAIPDPAPIQQNSGLQTVNIFGISAGPANESAQTIAVSAVSNNTGLIPNPTVIYTSPNATGSLSYTPVFGQSGSAQITVTVMDNGGVLNSGDDTFTRQFTVVVIAPGITVTLSGGALNITDTNLPSNDTLTISLNGSNVRINDPNQRVGAGAGLTQVDANTVDVPLASITGNIQVNTLAGNDTLTLSLAGGDFIPAGGLTFNGGDPTTGPGDKLIITGGSQGTVTYNYTNAHDGNIVMSTFGTVTYTGLEPITNSGTATDIIFNLPAGPNAATLADDGTSANTMSRLSGATFETTDFANPTTSVTINRGNAADTMQVDALPDLTASLTIGSAGGGEFGTVTFGGAVSLPAPNEAPGGNAPLAVLNKSLAAFASGTISLPNSTSDLATSGSGTISLTTATNIALGSGASLTTVNGALTLNANQQVSATAGNFVGIDVNDAVVQSTGTGTVTVRGKGGNNAAGAQNGVQVHGSGGLVKGGSGAGTTTTVEGFGAGSGAGGSNTGVLVGLIVGDGGGTISSFGGGVSVTGTGGTGTGGSQIGVRVSDAGAVITAGGSGAVTVIGFGGTSGSNGAQFGVDVRASAQITSGGGAVSVTGTGGTGATGSNQGVSMGSNASVSVITSGGNGSVTVTGTGGTGVSGNNDGIGMFRACRITAGGTGIVTVEGTGGSGSSTEGVQLLANSGLLPAINSGGGSITVTGTSSTGLAISLSSQSQIQSASNAAVTLVGDSMAIDTSSAVVGAGSGMATLRPRTNGVAIDLGAATDPSAGPLGLTDGELDRVTAGTLNLGNANSGAVTVSANLTRTAATVMNVASGANIDISGGSLSNTGGNVTLQPGTNAFPSNSGVDVTTSATSTLGITSGKDLKIVLNNTTVDSGYTQLNVAGLVNITGVNLALSGSYVPVLGNTFILVSNDGTDAVAGTFNGLSEGALFPFNGVQMRITYIGGTGNDVVVSPNTYTLTYTAGPNGSISGTSPQTVLPGGSGTAVTAVPNTGYHFVDWSDASTQNPRTDTNVTADISVTANFAINTYTLTYTAGPNGSISGTSPQTVNHGADGTAVTAVPNAGYHFVDWSDASTQNPRTDTNVTADISVTANFAINTYTLTYTAGSNGSISGTSPQTVNHGASGTTVTAVPSAGYHFVNWSDSSTANPRTDTNVTANISVTASFAINTYTLTYDGNGNTGGTAPVDGSSPYNHNSTVTVLGNTGSLVKTGYTFNGWNTAADGTGTSYNPADTFSITANTTLYAQWTIIPTPTLGNYPDTSIPLSENTTVTPDAAPTDTTSINVSTSTNFDGTFAANPTTGVVTVTDAHPAGAYTVTIKAFGPSGTATKTFTLTVTDGTVCNGNLSFTSAADVSTGSSPISVAIGDFNGDGKQDLAVANLGSATVSIRLGDGVGGFSGSTNVSVGGSPQSVAIGDFNGDGKQDLAVANQNTVAIRLGDGLGGFSGSTNVSAQSIPYSVAIGDFNGDGKQDLAVANFNNNTVSIRLGDGVGGFSGSTNVSVGSRPLSVAIGDFDGDGKQDFATANTDSNTVSIRLGDGLGGFSGSTEISVGSSPQSVTIGDFDGDGKQDLAVPHVGATSIRLGNGLGGFGGSTEVSGSSTSVAIGDFNGDGKQDLAVANFNTNTVSIRLGDGVGGFSGSTNVSVGSTPYSVAIGDFNGDGKQDLAVANLQSNTVSIRLGICTPVVNLSVSTNASTETGATVVTVTATASDSVVGNQTVSLGVSGTNITAGDYTLSDSTITILNGATTGSVTFTVVDDSVYEGTETAALTISAPSSGIALGATTTQNITITDNDTAPSFAIEDVSHNEGNSSTTSYVFTVTKTGSTAVNATVDFTTQDGTATVANSDYQLNSGSLTFLPGDTTKTITVLVNGDTTNEANEIFTVHLSGATNATIGDADGTGTINNDDNPPTISDIADTSTIEDTATGAIAFTVGDAETAAGSLTVSGSSSDTTLVPNANIVFGGSGADRTVTITPADNQNGTATITVSVSDGPHTTSDNFVLTVTEVNDAPTAVDDSLSNITEDSGQRTISFASLTGNDSAGPNETGQTLTITAVSNPVGGTVSVSGTDVLFTPTANFNGAAGFDYTIQDNGTTDGSADPRTDVGAVTFNITAVNDAPSFSNGSNQAVDKNAGAQSVPNWATNISAGPADESGQTLSFLILNNSNTALFAVAPAITSSGTLTYTPATDATGTATITIALKDSGGIADDGEDTSPSQTFTVTIYTPFQTWQHLHFNAAELADLNISGPLADPNSNGLPNLLEYAFHLDPKAQTTGNRPAVERDGTYVSLIYTKTIAATDLTYTIEQSTDMVTWTTASPTDVILSDDGTIQRIKAQVAHNGATKLFLKLRVTLN